jgi:UDP-N-acetylglucosamine 2-epimerase (non-hydrolysing)
MREVVSRHINEIENSDVLDEIHLISKKYFVCSLHRQENVSQNSTRKELINAMNRLAEDYKLPLILSGHPRLVDALCEDESLHNSILLTKPFGFFDWCKLQKESFITISDSGSVSEEAAILRFKAITPRAKIERQEAIEAGTIIRCNPEVGAIMKSVEYAISTDEMIKSAIPVDYTIDNTSDRIIANIINHI